jgi:transcriptional antiterminator
MLKGDIGKLAENVGVSKSTIYRVAEKINLDLKPVHGRCDKTVDYISGTTLSDEQDLWLDMATEKILKYREQKQERKILNKSDVTFPKQMEIA